MKYFNLLVGVLCTFWTLVDFSGSHIDAFCGAMAVLNLALYISPMYEFGDYR